jgi:hypothetical protein
MSSLKQSRHFVGNPITVRGLALLEDRSVPISVRDIIAGHDSRNFQGSISTGDVVCNWSMVVWRNGFWTATADFVDNGDLAGDFFFVELLLDKTHSVGARLEGSIIDLDDRKLSLRQEGIDRWIRENWDRFEASGPSIRLHAAPAAALVALKTAGLVLLAVVVAVIVVGVGIFASKHTKVGRCPGQSPNDTDEHGRLNPCVEFAPAPES